MISGALQRINAGAETQGAATAGMAIDPLLDSVSLPPASSPLYRPALRERRRALTERYAAMTPEARGRVLIEARKPFLALLGPEPGRTMAMDLRREQFVALHTSTPQAERVQWLVELSLHRASLRLMTARTDPGYGRATQMLDLELHALQACLHAAAPSDTSTSPTPEILQCIATRHRQLLFLHMFDVYRMLSDPPQG